MKKIVAVCAVALSLAACTGTGSVKGDRALTGAALGGAGGALIGGLASNSVGGALAGGAIGAAGGAIIGAATAPPERCYYDNRGRRYCRR